MNFRNHNCQTSRCYWKYQKQISVSSKPGWFHLHCFQSRGKCSQAAGCLQKTRFKILLHFEQQTVSDFWWPFWSIVTNVLEWNQRMLKSSHGTLLMRFHASEMPLLPKNQPTYALNPRRLFLSVAFTEWWAHLSFETWWKISLVRSNMLSLILTRIAIQLDLDEFAFLKIKDTRKQLMLNLLKSRFVNHMKSHVKSHENKFAGLVFEIIFLGNKIHKEDPNRSICRGQGLSIWSWMLLWWYKILSTGKLNFISQFFINENFTKILS